MKYNSYFQIRLPVRVKVRVVKKGFLVFFIVVVCSENSNKTCMGCVPIRSGVVGCAPKSTSPSL